MANLAGQKDFEAIYQEVADEVFDNVTAGTGTDPSLVRVKSYVNDAYRELVSEFPAWFKFKEFTPSTPSDPTFTLALSDEIVRIESIQIPSIQLLLREMTREMFNAYHPGGQSITGPGNPVAWIAAPRASNNALQVDFYPTPDQAYVLSVWAEVRFSDLSATTDVPVITPEWQDVLIKKAKMYAFLKVGDPRAEDFRQLYEERHTQMWLAYEQHLSHVNTWRDAFSETSAHGYPGLYHPYTEGV